MGGKGRGKKVMRLQSKVEERQSETLCEGFKIQYKMKAEKWVNAAEVYPRAKP